MINVVSSLANAHYSPVSSLISFTWEFFLFFLIKSNSLGNLLGRAKVKSRYLSNLPPDNLFEDN